MDKIVVSVITPVFNGRDHIQECIHSVAEQTLTGVEHVIVDGKSNDGTLDIIQEMMKTKPGIKLISENDSGIYDAMNKGIAAASGEFVIFMGADDIFYDKDILRFVQASGLMQQYDLVYGKVWFKHKKMEYGKEATLESLKQENIPHQAILYRRSLFGKLGNYGHKFKVSEDYVFNIKCFKEASVRKVFIDKVFSVFNDSATSSYFRDGFIKYRLFYFDKLSWSERLKKWYYYFRPDWFVPSRLFRKS